MKIKLYNVVLFWLEFYIVNNDKGKFSKKIKVLF